MPSRLNADTKLTDALERALANEATACSEPLRFTPLKALRRGVSLALRTRQKLRRMAGAARVEFVDG